MGLQSKKSVWQLKKPSGYRTQHWQEFTTDGIRDNRFLFCCCWALNFSWDNAFFLLVDLLYTLHWRRLSYSRAAPCIFSFFFLRAKMKRTKPASGRKAEYSWVLFQFFLNRFLLSVLSFSENPPYTSPRNIAFQPSLHCHLCQPAANFKCTLRSAASTSGSLPKIRPFSPIRDGESTCENSAKYSTK